MLLTDSFLVDTPPAGGRLLDMLRAQREGCTTEVVKLYRKVNGLSGRFSFGPKVSFFKKALSTLKTSRVKLRGRK